MGEKHTGASRGSLDGVAKLSAESLPIIRNVSAPVALSVGRASLSSHGPHSARSNL